MNAPRQGVAISMGPGARGHWDTALAGPPPLRAALLRQLRGDIGGALGLVVVDSLLDISKLYENISVELAFKAATKHRFPPRALWFALLVRRAARVLQHPASVSRDIVPTASLLAGCMCSVSLTRALIHDLARTAHDRAGPLARLATHVGDIHAQLIAPAAKAADTAVRLVGAVAHVASAEGSLGVPGNCAGSIGNAGGE